MTTSVLAFRRRTPRPRARVAMVAACALFILWAHSTHASDSDAKREADREFNAGRKALDHGDWSTACAHFEMSMKLDPSVSTLVKIGRCRDHDNKLETARKTYEEARALNHQATTDADRRRRLEDAIDADLKKLRPRIPKLRVRILGPPAGQTTILLDGISVAREWQEVPIELDPGKHVISARAAEFHPEQRTIEATEGATIEVLIELTREPPISAAPPVLAPPTMPAVVERHPSTEIPPPARAAAASVHSDSNAGSGASRRRIAGWSLSATGAIGLGIAAYFGVHTLVLVSDADCDANNTCSYAGKLKIDQAKEAQTTGFIAAGIGAAVLIAGVVLVVTSPAAPKKPGGNSPSTALAAGAGPGGLWMGATW